MLDRCKSNRRKYTWSGWGRGNVARNGCGARVERIHGAKPKPVHYVKRCHANRNNQAYWSGRGWGCFRVNRRSYKTATSFCNKVKGAYTVSIRNVGQYCRCRNTRATFLRYRGNG